MQGIKITNKWGKWAWVLPEFIEKYPNYTNSDIYYWIEEYLHNTKGPAIISSIFGQELYYLNGKRFNRDEWEKEVYNMNFIDEMEKIINE
jgi:hypothetical protein